VQNCCQVYQVQQGPLSAVLCNPETVLLLMQVKTEYIWIALHSSDVKGLIPGCHHWVLLSWCHTFLFPTLYESKQNLLKFACINWFHFSFCVVQFCRLIWKFISSDLCGSVTSWRSMQWIVPNIISVQDSKDRF
jgi:hypothetical protein